MLTLEELKALPTGMSFYAEGLQCVIHPSAHAFSCHYDQGTYIKYENEKSSPDRVLVAKHVHDFSLAIERVREFLYDSYGNNWQAWRNEKERRLEAML